jgi:hypothetical protein
LSSWTMKPEKLMDRSALLDQSAERDFFTSAADGWYLASAPSR